jgi:hypothetical protein
MAACTMPERRLTQSELFELRPWPWEAPVKTLRPPEEEGRKRG